MLVRSAGRRVHDQIIHFAPLDIFQELLDQSVLLRPAPDDSVVTVGQHELNAHHAQVVAHPHRLPSGVGNVNRFGLDSHHLRYARPTNIRVHDSHHVVRIASKCVC